MKWAIAGGGTGGHVTPALALAEAIVARGDEVLVIGSRHGLDAQWVPEAGLPFVALGSRQVMNRDLKGRLTGIAGILGGALKAHGILRRFGAGIVVSVGGYAAMPAILAAVASRTPLALVEPNAVPGRVHRLGARFAGRIFVGFDAARDALPGARKRVQNLGIPLPAKVIDALGETAPRDEGAHQLRLLIFGGSQGARQINDAVIRALPRLDGCPLEIFHQTGSKDLERVAAAYAETKLASKVVAFESDMASRYRWADLALCRAGALSLAELAASGLPGLLVPYPYAADDHQAANARAFEAAGAARVLGNLEPDGGDGTAVVAALEPFLKAPRSLIPMSQAAKRWARPSAARDIVSACADWREARN